MGLKRIGLIKLITILSFPPEGLSGLPFQSLCIYTTALEEHYMLVREVITYYCTKIHRCKIACSGGIPSRDVIIASFSALRHPHPESVETLLTASLIIFFEVFTFLFSIAIIASVVTASSS